MLTVLYLSVGLDIIVKFIIYRKYLSLHVFDESYPVHC